MNDSTDNHDEWVVRELKGDWKDNLRQKTGKDLSLRFLVSGTVGNWKGYCRVCDYTTSSVTPDLFLDMTDKIVLHCADSGHEVLVAGNAGAELEDFEIVIKTLGIRITLPCKQCDAEDDNEYFTFGLCSGCHEGLNKSDFTFGVEIEAY
jgi:hypothetical protein